ncbi:MAG: type III-B CRISPR-associated protein Cas10/Cmr2 [Spirochaetales bacterium]|nr:type III-B CRISPR-associated protein Cas10/Cmr2 [Spirochaetales bacterium]
MTNWSRKIRAFLNDLPDRIFNSNEYTSRIASAIKAWTGPEDDDINFIKLKALVDPQSGEVHKGDAALCITHPISRARLYLDLPECKKAGEALLSVLERLLKKTGNDPRKRFLTLFEAWATELSRRERSIGLLWPIIPHSTLLPDHPVWQHNALVSALTTCGDDPQILAFSIGPVNHFTSHTSGFREFRDASLIFSGLLWAGMKAVCRELGPDHILYPAVSGQPFFRSWLNDEKLTGVKPDYRPADLGIPPYSNTSVAVIPGEEKAGIVEMIQKSIRKEWAGIAEAVRKYLPPLSEKAGKEWKDQTDHYLVFTSAAAAWHKDFEKGKNQLKNEEAVLLRKISAYFRETDGASLTMSLLYLSAHQTGMHNLSSAKKAVIRDKKDFPPSTGCTSCQSLPYIDIRQGDKFIGPDERLCAPCLIKRLIYRVSSGLDNPLKTGLRIPAPETPSLADKEGYFAVLSMDGDRMGRLTRGESDRFARWVDVFCTGKEEDASLHSFLGQKRRVTPFVHLSLSKALGNFSLISVPYVIKKHKGILLYAGGDDVVALLPVKTALEAADEIQSLYRSAFILREKDGTVHGCKDGFPVKPGKADILLHPGPAVTLSAALVLTRGKNHAGKLLSLARQILDDRVKELSGRDSLGIALVENREIREFIAQKWRDSGGSRFIDHFTGTGAVKEHPDIPNISDLLKSQNK